jgi:hypothetical protein
MDAKKTEMSESETREQLFALIIQPRSYRFSLYSLCVLVAKVLILKQKRLVLICLGEN